MQVRDQYLPGRGSDKMISGIRCSAGRALLLILAAMTVSVSPRYSKAHGAGAGNGGDRSAGTDPPRIDAAVRKEVIDKVALYMKDFYVFSSTGEMMAARIRMLDREGRYDAFDDVREFCDEVTSDLRDICHDRHVFVFHSPEEAKEVAARKGLLPDDEIEKIELAHLERDRQANFGFQAIDILDGNLGYIKLNYFSRADEACEKVVGAIGRLGATDAIIIDLRDNRGGGGGVGAVLSSYFFSSRKVQLTGIYYRRTDSIEQSWTLPYLPGKRLPEIDLYILTGPKTFSAAEDFSYTMKHLGRATIVGERTKGGAHPVDVMIVKDAILVQISIGNSVNPITGTNWEGTGVIPDIEVPEGEALDRAILVALKKVLDRTGAGRKKENLRSLIRWMEQEALLRTDP
ncbi:MAG: S41 family peptidase [Candidatus Krumholzibacteriota bacterium]|nr:S41 family peptidase [Candidatus Krumholzibacteriota bacterium]